MKLALKLAAKDGIRGPNPDGRRSNCEEHPLIGEGYHTRCGENPRGSQRDRKCNGKMTSGSTPLRTQELAVITGKRA